jgi:hypothetical protein
MKLVFWSVLAACCTAATVRQPDVNEIVRRSVQAIEADWAQAPHYSFVERDVISKRTSTPVVKTYEVLTIDGSPYHRQIAVNDQPLSEGARAEEERKLRAEIARREHESDRERAKRIAKYERERDQDHAMLYAMAEAFDYRLVGEEKVNGHDCWVLEASPKRGYQPRNRETRVLTGMAGKLWVDKNEYQWVKVSAEVTKPVSFYGFFAKVGPGTRFELEQEPVADNLWLPKHFSVHVNATAFGFINENSTDDETYGSYKPVSGATAKLSKP